MYHWLLPLALGRCTSVSTSLHIFHSCGDDQRKYINVYKFLLLLPRNCKIWLFFCLSLIYNAFNVKQPIQKFVPKPFIIFGLFFSHFIGLELSRGWQISQFIAKCTWLTLAINCDICRPHSNNAILVARQQYLQHYHIIFIALSAMYLWKIAEISQK